MLAVAGPAFGGEHPRCSDQEQRIVDRGQRDLQVLIDIESSNPFRRNRKGFFVATMNLLILTLPPLWFPLRDLDFSSAVDLLYMEDRASRPSHSYTVFGRRTTSSMAPSSCPALVSWVKDERVVAGHLGLR